MTMVSRPPVTATQLLPAGKGKYRDAPHADLESRR